jgi:arylsulfatase A-like enzyme
MRVLLLLSLLAPAVDERPNILWITCEDISPHLGAYGDAYARTPNLDALAKQGTRYTRAFSTAGVCAPSRSTIILGVMATTVGSHFMRCSATPPASMRGFPAYLDGYYRTNNVKTDYNFDTPKGTWDESSAKAHWRNRKPGQPFFAVFNFTQCHESQIRISEAQHQKRIEGFEPHDPAKAEPPPYHPDSPEVRRDWARYADGITRMDLEVGRLLRELEEDGLAKSTIVFFFSDHGAGMPRSKRWLYDSSLRVPFIVRFPDGKGAGTTSDRLISLIDAGPTALSLAGVKPPAHMQGRPFLGAHEAPPREFVYGARDRMDERNDLCRAVRDSRFKYIRNYMPHRPWAQHVGYMFEMPTMRVWKKAFDAGTLNPVQRRFFERKPFEELYDTQADPHEVRNLADDPSHAGTLDRLRRALDAWMIEIRDLGFIPEPEIQERLAAPPPVEKLMAAAAASARGEDEAKLVELAKDVDSAVRYWGVLGLLGRGSTHDVLRAALKDVAPAVRFAAAEALGTEEALTALEAGIRDGNPWARHHALLAIDALGPKAASLKPAVELARKDKNDYVKRVAEHILR